MKRLVRKYSDGTSLYFSGGKFDNFCVYQEEASGSISAPKDSEYFEDLIKLSNEFGFDKVYSDFLKIYNATSSEVTRESLKCIEDIAFSYNESRVFFAKTMTIIHMGMVAQNNKQFTKLGKRIKRLGVHKLLCEGNSVEEAAHFMRGMGWREIDELCSERGF